MVSKSRKVWVMSSAVHPRERRRILLYIAVLLCTALVLEWPEFFAAMRKKQICFYFLVHGYFDWGLSSALCSLCSVGSQCAHSHPSSSVLMHCCHWVVVTNQAGCAQPFLFLSKSKILLFRGFNRWNYNKKYLVNAPCGLFPYASKQGEKEFPL